MDSSARMASPTVSRYSSFAGLSLPRLPSVALVQYELRLFNLPVYLPNDQLLVNGLDWTQPVPARHTKHT